MISSFGGSFTCFKLSQRRNVLSSINSIPSGKLTSSRERQPLKAPVKIFFIVDGKTTFFRVLQHSHINSGISVKPSGSSRFSNGQWIKAFASIFRKVPGKVILRSFAFLKKKSPSSTSTPSGIEYSSQVNSWGLTSINTRP